MNSTIFGTLTGLAVILASIFMVSSDAAIFMNTAGLLIVMGGSASAAFVTFSFKELKTLTRVVATVLRKPVDNTPALITEIVTFAHETQGNRTALGQLAGRTSDPFFRDGLQLLIDRLASDKIKSILVERMQVIRDDHTLSIKMLKTLGKYPPAFGMIGTVIGLVATLQGLGGELGAASLGPAMAVGLITTLYGLVMANLFFIPMADNLALKSALDLKRRKMVAQAVVMMSMGEKATQIQDALNSMTKPEHRRDVLGIGSNPQNGQRAS